MKSILILSFVVVCCARVELWAQTSPADNDASLYSSESALGKSAAALRTFQENAPAPAQMLLDKVDCVAVAPRHDRGQNAMAAKGFVSCRRNRNAAWTNPAAIVISGGGTFWPVMGAEIDLIILAVNQPATAHFGDRDEMLGSPNFHTVPGPVRQDQFPLRTYPSILAYQQSAQGIEGINISGASVNEDRATNALLYGKELSNLAILSREAGGPGSPAVEQFLAVLSSCTSEQSGAAIAEPSEKPLILKPE